jgi:hypothetical protein
MSREATISSLLALLLLVPVSAQGQSPRMQAYFSYGAVSLASSETFDAVAGSTRAGSLGGGVQLTRLWRLLFADLGFSRQRLDGERVFVSDGVVFPLDIPLEVSFTPFDIAAGWRFERQRFSPYVGGGLSLITYKESSPFGRAGDDVNERGTGLLMLAGLDVPVWRFVSVGGELRYRAVSGVLGEGGASEAFGEDQLGGVQYSVRVSVGR